MTLGRLRIRVRPQLILPFVLAGALLAVALSLGDLSRVLGRVGLIPTSVLVFVLALALVYCLLKLGQFYLLLANLGLHPDRRRLLAAFAVGELTLTLPFGVFAQNWLLTVTGTDTRFGHSSAATLVMLLTETLVVLVWLAVAGIPHWPPLRPVAAVVALGVVLFVPVALALQGSLTRYCPGPRYRRVRRMLSSLSDLLAGCKQLARPCMLGLNIFMAAAYLGALAWAFTSVGQAVGLTGLDYRTAASIYAFSLAVVLLGGGALSQIGTVEVLGMGAAQAFGYGLTDGLALMLAFRLVWTGAIWLINLPVVVVLWRSLRRPRSAASTDRV
ncbi:hypothetical protein [Salinisphaera sp.]|uniref:hypothetical protein n=1 Tax=Salinisphaera sp. TaxID=1914330 RepID=UPI002D76CBFA|nr:hypothetical protein [Salinisphaera sp.]HET7315569.1 hypothetical protein [Salinisphaera sp.]